MGKSKSEFSKKNDFSFSFVRNVSESRSLTTNWGGTGKVKTN